MNKYLKALSRSDMSDWLVHFIKEKGAQHQPLEVLFEILTSGKILASKAPFVTKYSQMGAACFYEVPPQNWIELINTNPNARRGFGLIVSKVVFWHLGGRPLIYTEKTDPLYWPKEERFRLSNLDLSKIPPTDWTHEREWRLPGDLNIYNKEIPYVWWWPCVEKEKEAQLIFRKYSGIHTIYIIEPGKTLERNETIF